MVKDLPEAHSFPYRLSVKLLIAEFDGGVTSIPWEKGAYEAHIKKAHKLKEWMLGAARDLCIGPETCALWQGINPHTGTACFFFKLYDTLFVVDRDTIAAMRWLLINFDETEERSPKELKKAERYKMNGRLRFEIMARDEFTCQICGRSPKTHAVALEVDHIVPIDKGGHTHKGNLLTLCTSCNKAKRAGMYPQLIRPECFDPPIEAYPGSDDEDNREWIEEHLYPTRRWGTPTTKVRAKPLGVRRLFRLILGELLLFMGKALLLHDDDGGDE